MGIRFYNLNGFFVKKLALGVYYSFIHYIHMNFNLDVLYDNALWQYHTVG